MNIETLDIERVYEGLTDDLEKARHLLKIAPNGMSIGFRTELAVFACAHALIALVEKLEKHDFEERDARGRVA